MKQTITSLSDTLKESLVAFLRDIIAIPSTGGKEQAVVQRIHEEMTSLGYDKVWVDPLGNLFGQMAPGNGSWPLTATATQWM